MFRPAEQILCGLSGRYGQTRVEDTDESGEFYGLRGHIDWMPIRQTRLRGEVFLDRLSGDIERTVDAGVSSSFEVYYGAWSGKLVYTFLDENDERFNDRRTNHYLLLQLRRALW